jgi:hypothetical protein
MSLLNLLFLVLISSIFITSVSNKQQHHHHHQQLQHQDQGRQPYVHQRGPGQVLNHSIWFNEVILNGTGVIFSATAPALLNTCLINTLCRYSIPVIIYLPISTRRTNNFSAVRTSTLTSECPTVVHLSTSLQLKHFPHITAKTTHARLKRARQTINTTNADVIYARSFKIKSIKHCPFQNTLYLDNDIDILDLNRTMDYFNIMMQLNKSLSLRNDKVVHAGHHYESVSINITERNAGVIYMDCRNKFVRYILDRWEVAYFHNATFDYHDQGPFRVALHRHLRYLTKLLLDLPEEYNCRYELSEVQRNACIINHVKPFYKGVLFNQTFIQKRTCAVIEYMNISSYSNSSGMVLGSRNEI